MFCLVCQNNIGLFFALRVVMENYIINKCEKERMLCKSALRSGIIVGYVTVAIDGGELFCSTKNSCKGCLKRKNKAEETEYFHRSVVCVAIGSNPHVILGREMLEEAVQEAKKNREWRHEYMTLLVRDLENVEKGEELMSALMQKLVEDKRFTETKRMKNNKDYRLILYREYHMI